MNVIEVLRRKERIAGLISNGGVVTIWLALLALIVTAYAAPQSGGLFWAFALTAIAGLTAEVVGGAFASTYRIDRENIETGQRLGLEEL